MAFNGEKQQGKYSGEKNCTAKRDFVQQAVQNRCEHAGYDLTISFLKRIRPG